MKKFMIMLALFILPLFVGLVVAGDVSFADTKDGICDGIGATGASCDDTAGAEDSVNNLVATVINVFSWIVGVVAVIFVIFGGFKYITSGGDSNKVSSAKNTILYAIVGLIIVALAQVIVVFVLNAAT